jgi:hypothetical protein
MAQLEQSERERLLYEANLNGDYETDRDLKALRSAEIATLRANENDRDIRANLIKDARRVMLREQILSIARSSGVPLIDPLLGRPLPEPDQDSLLGAEDARKVIAILWGDTASNGESSNADAEKATRPRASDPAVNEWYQSSYLPDCVNLNQQPSQQDDWGAAKQEFGVKVRREQVLDARKKFAPPEWKIQGRKPARIIPPK